MSAAKYGGLPSWLPKPKTRAGRVVGASAARPALAIEGDTVSAEVTGARVLVTAVGPEVPPQIHYPPPRTAPCTFIVTYASASRTIPLITSAFTIVDELGVLHRPRVTSMDGAVAPTQVTPGRTVSLKLYDVLPTGSGTIRWAPTKGRPTVSWDFDVEVD